MSMVAQLADEVAQVGVRCSFGVPGGGTSLSLIDDLIQRGVEFHTTCHEGAAAIMAGTTGFLGRSPGLAIGIKGPGLANMVAGLAACYLENFPVVAVAEAYPEDGPLGTVHKFLDHRGLVSAIAKGRRARSTNGPDFKELANWSMAEVPGPVLMDLPAKPASSQPPVPAQSEQSSVGVGHLIQQATRPIVIAGTLAARRGWSDYLNDLKIPVFSTAAAKGVVNEKLAHAAGVFTGVGLESTPESALLNEADLIVGVGLRARELLAIPSFDRPAINIDNVPAHQKMHFAASCSVGSAPEVFTELSQREWGLDEVARARTRLRERMERTGFLPVHAFGVLAQQLGEDSRIVLDTGNFCTVGEHVWRASRAGLWLSSGQGRNMGIGLPVAISASLQEREFPTVLVIGDGGIATYFSELRLAVSKQLPLLVVMISDGGFGSIRTRAVREGLDQSSLLFPGVSWIAAAEGIGMSSVGIESEDALASVVGAWRDNPTPTYAEIHIDAEAYQGMLDGIR